MKQSQSGKGDDFVIDTNFQKILNLSNEHIALTTAEGKVIYSNGGIEAILGYSAEEYYSMDFRHGVHPDDFTIVADFFRNIYKNPGERQSVIFRSLHKKGDYLWTEVRGTNLLYESDVQALVFQLSDASARIQLKSQLHQYAKRMELLHEIDKGIINAREIPELVQAVLERIQELIPCEVIFIALYNWDTGEAELFARTSQLDTPNVPRKLPFPQDWVRSFDNEAIKIIDDLNLVNPLPPMYQFGKANGARSYMHIPLKNTGQTIGFLTFASLEAQFFNKEYQDIGIDVADQLAIAIRQLNLDKHLVQHSVQLAEQIQVLEWAEQALIESETRYRRVVEDQTDLICRYTKECRLTFVNKAYAEAFGESPENMLGQIFLKWIPESEHKAALEHIQSMSRENPIAVYEHVAIMPDGSRRWHQWTDQAFYDDLGEIIGYQGVGRDITERKLAEEAQAQERQFKDALLGALAALNMPLDLDSVMSRILSQAAEVVPCDAGSIFLFEGDFGRVVQCRGFPADAVEALRELRMPINSTLLKRAFEGSFAVADTQKESEWFVSKGIDWIRSSLGIPIVVGSRVIGMLSCDSATPNYFNETHLAKLEAFALYAGIALERVYYVEQLQSKVQERTQELQQSSVQLESIIDSSFEAILQLSADLKILRSNPAYKKLMQSEVITRKTLLDKVFDADKSAMQRFVEKLLTEQSAGEIELRLVRPNGSIFEAGLSLAYVPATGTEDYRFVATIHNISERKEQERQLRYNAVLQENVKDAVIVTDMQFIIQSWNKAAEVIYGWRDDEVLGKRSADILKTEFTNDTPREYYLRELSEKSAVTGEFIQHHRDGRKLHIFASTTIVRDAHGEPFAVISVNRDISERKQIEMALKAKTEEEREFQIYLKRLHELNIELSKISDLNEFYKQAVTLGRERFGFERIGLLLYDEDKQSMTGTYGTNAAGEIVDERHFEFKPDTLTGILGKALTNSERFVYEENTPLYDNQNLIAHGWNAVAALWNGEKSLGCLAVDSGLSNRPASKPLLDALALYASNLATSLSERRIAIALSESEERFRLFIEDAPLAVVITNKTGIIQLINSEAEELLGYQRAEIIGKPIEILVPEAQRQGHQKLREGYTENPNKRTMGNIEELFVRRKDGGLFWADIQLSYIRVEDDMLIMAFIEDISERKLAEESLKLYATETEDLYNNAPCGYHSLDSNGLIVAINDTELQWLGYQREEILGRRYFQDLISEESRKGFLEGFPNFKKLGIAQDLEFELIRKDGSTFFVALSATAIRDDEGNYVMSRSTVFDITERKEAQRLLEQSLAREKELGELKSRFVSMASHEFRTPLAVIKTSSDMVMRYGDKQGMEWSKTKLSKISEQITHLTNIINDVLDLGRLQSGKIEFNPQMEDLAELTRTILEEFRSRSDVSHLFVDEIADNLPMLMLDIKLMRQLINNLLSNAVKYSKPEQPIGLKLWQDKNEIVLEVHDKGIGIPEEDLAHLFEPFHRATNVVGIQGTGMGLSITKEIAEQHGGRIYAESKVGQGTSMFLRIPLQSIP